MKLKLFGMRRLALGAALSVAALLASCGGGSQVETFAAGRVLVFGDEASVITSTGAKYSVNALVAGTSTLDCATFPIWVQSVAAHYGLTFPECPGSVAAPASRIYAAPGAKVADISAQIDGHLANGGALLGTDLATVMAGTNDIVEIFGNTSVDRMALATQRGQDLGLQVNRLAAAGAKVLISTIPDVSLTPWGIANNNAAPGGGILHDLTRAFNDGVRGTITNNGRQIGLMLADGLFQNMVTVPTGFSPNLTNVIQAACTTALPDCTTATLGADTAGNPASASTWMWADSLWPGPTPQAYIGSLAVTRVANNPF